MSCTLRPLSTADLDSLEALRPPDWPPFGPTFTAYFQRPFCFPFGLDHDGALAATGTLIQFGTSGWLAQIITRPGLRGQGRGTTVLRFLVEEARRRGIQTLSLVATDEGAPLYAKAGFRVDGEYDFWGRPTPAPAEPAASVGLEAGGGWDRSVAELDRAASGEDREGWLSDLTDGVWAVTSDRGPEGFYLPLAGEGLVVARNPRAGAALLHRRIDGAQRVVVPVENPGPREVLEGRGFTWVRRQPRMVLGPALDRRPDWVWSRIAGNLG